jgi:hypothetical protein
VTPDTEARFIQLWTQGASYADIAAAMTCALGTVGSRASTLVRQGKIQPRPRGGTYPRQQALARQEGAPAAPPAPTRDTPAITMVAVPELREMINRFSVLEARVAALEDGTRAPPAPAPHPHPRTHPRTHPRPTRGSTSSSGPCGCPRR